MVLLYHHLTAFLRFIHLILLLGTSLVGASVLVRYPINQVQTASLLMPNQIAPGLGWDFLTPPHAAGLDYGSPNGFLRDRAPGGFLAQGWKDGINHAANQYFEFTIQPREHCIAQLDGISMATITTSISHGNKAPALSPRLWEVTLSLGSMPGLVFTVLREPTLISGEASQTIHLFQEAGDFSGIPPIIGPDSATFRIYGLNARPIKPNQDTSYGIHAVGGLIHTTINEQTFGSDLILHGEIYCKKETYNLLSKNGIKNPLIESLKLQDATRFDLPSGGLSMIPEPKIAGWIGVFIGLLGIAV
ncbi:MAG: hypothetical protein KDD43_12210, partial [Bdellovibrionales bacterium]|nr:hypothetical protein [Bdellovibrionales bacterium]